jgi:hypothetical protein
MLAHLGDGLKQLYGNEDDSDVIWTKLEAKYKGVIHTQKSQIRKEWETLGVDNAASLDDFEVRLNTLCQKMILCGYSNLKRERLVKLSRLSERVIMPLGQH